MNISTRQRYLDVTDILAQADRVAAVVAQARSAMLSPHAQKRSPLYSSTQLAHIVGLDRNKWTARWRKGDLPQGTQREGGRKLEFTVAEVRQWARAMRMPAMRPESSRAIVVAVANFKGGVSKTTTTMTLAQGLSLRGHRVLVVDLDPQASLTTLMGLLPDADVDMESTALPCFLGQAEDIKGAIQSTYWNGIDLVASSSELFGAEFALPSRQSSTPSFEFWAVLAKALEKARDDYDVILLDTPPALSYVTINALFAADGVLVPLPMNALDFASSAVFWRLFGDLFSSISERGTDKKYAFIDILPSKVESTDLSSLVVREWVSAAYVERVLPVDIPKTAAAGTAAKEFGTVYDADSELSGTRTFRRATDAFEHLVDIIEHKSIAFWRLPRESADQPVQGRLV